MIVLRKQVSLWPSAGRWPSLAASVATSRYLTCTSGSVRSVMFARNGRRERAYSQSDSTEGSTDLTPRRRLRLTHKGHLGPTIALLFS